MAGSAACSDDGDDLPPPPSADEGAATMPSAPTLDARDAEAWAEIQTKFDGFMETWIKWAAEGSPGGFENPATIELAEYAYVFLHDDVAVELFEHRRNGLVRTGRPEWRNALLIGIDWDRMVQDLVVPETIFEVCVDDSDWVVVDADSSDPVEPDAGRPQVWTITAWWAEEREFGPDGWALSRREVGGSRSC
jgi:hypothetical protein